MGKPQLWAVERGDEGEFGHQGIRRTTLAGPAVGVFVPCYEAALILLNSRKWLASHSDFPVVSPQRFERALDRECELN